MKSSAVPALAFALLTLGGLTLGQRATLWTPQDLQRLSSLALTPTTPPPDPTNAVADDPRAVTLGHKLFFEKRFSENNDVSCATCHQPQRVFTDGKALSEGVGTTTRNTPTIVGATWNAWQFWDGRSDSLWAQALGPIESPAEHGFTRTGVAHVIAEHHQQPYEALFGPLPDFEDRLRFPERASPVGDPDAQREWTQMTEGDRAQVNRLFVNVGKAIAAYERQFKPGLSRFDRYAQSLARGQEDTTLLRTAEINGARLFIGAAGCIACHSGSMLSDGRFHNTGVPRHPEVDTDIGRTSGLENLSRAEFGCSSIYSDARSTCKASDTSAQPRDLRAYKTPSLRTATRTAPYMHAGQLASIGDVLRHYRKAPKAPLGTSELQPLTLTDTELLELEAFLRSLEAPIDAPASLLIEPNR
jgi:cytochrome c peroxidase